MLLSYILLLMSISDICNTYRILLVFPLPWKSHSILGDGYVKHLLNAGHEITYITPYPKENPPEKLHQIDVSRNVIPDVFNIEKMINKKKSFDDGHISFKLFHGIVKSTLTNDNVVKLMNDQTQTFDLVVVEWLFNELYSGFSMVFNCPYIWASSMEPHSWILQLIDEVSNPAYNADMITSNTPPFNFVQRGKSLRTMFILNFILPMTEFKDYEQEFKKIFGPVMEKRGRYLTPLSEVKYNASMVLSNSHVSLGQATRLPQNFKNIAGYHVDSELKPLPEDLKTIMDNAKDGVIYFSMGSQLKSKDMPNVIKQDLIKMFGDLKQIVIWKFEDDLPGLPKNLHVMKWAPQQSIIAHKNCRIVITHGGLLSTIESLHYGVPLIGIPMFGDQFINVQRFEAKGFAKKVDLTYSLAEDLKKTVEEMLKDPKYYMKAKELSMIYHDRPTPPHKELVHWVEHVVRTRGAAHLRSPALLVPWYQKLYLDYVLLFFTVLLLLRNAIKYLKSVITKVNISKKLN